MSYDTASCEEPHTNAAETASEQSGAISQDEARRLFLQREEDERKLARHARHCAQTGDLNALALLQERLRGLLAR